LNKEKNQPLKQKNIFLIELIGCNFAISETTKKGSVQTIMEKALPLSHYRDKPFV
jgi:hypothetical protein